MTYPEAIQYLESFVNYEKIPSFPYRESLKLERMKGFLELLGNPQEGLRCLHIAGTKGKGSASVFAANILKEAGFRVGLYTSPHLVDFRERVRVLQKNQKSKIKNQKLEEFGGMISRQQITNLTKKIMPLIKKYNRISRYGRLTFFEVYTALAFLYFRHKNVDYAVLETGLGGRLDATSTVSPLVCAITPISYDHTVQLGETLKEIAKEKAGIIKSPQSAVRSPQPVVISAPQEREAREVIRNRCKEMGATLYEVGKDIVWHRTRDEGRGTRDEGRRVEKVAEFQSFAVKGRKRSYDNLNIRLLGEYQLDNAALAIGMVEALPNESITPLAIERGLKETVWPCRLEVASRHPHVILDGAQNVASAAALCKAIKSHFEYKKLILVLGMSKDKDIKGVSNILVRLASNIIHTKARNPRAAEPEFIRKMLPRQTALTHNVQEAIALAKRLAKAEDLILITGSLFVAGEARR